MISLLIILTFFAVIASTWWFGIWNNLLTLMNMILAGLIASAFYEGLARTLQQSMGYKNLVDFLAVWILFVVSFIVLRALTDITSSRKLNFDPLVEMIGQSILSIWIACVFLAFTLFTLHLSPLTPSDFQANATDSTMGIGPDRMWLAFIQSRSRGALSASKEANFLAKKYSLEDHPDDVELNVRVFDPRGTFIQENLSRRTKLAAKKALSE
jgi:phage-related holin